MSDEEFQGVGGIGLAHEVVVVVGGEGFVGGKDKMAVVERGGRLLDPEIAIGNLAVAPTRQRGAFRVPIEDVAEPKGSGGGFAIALAFLRAGLGGVEAAPPGEAAPAEVHGDGGIFGNPRHGGGVPPVQLEAGVPGVPTVGNGEEQDARRIRNGRGRERGREERKKKEKEEPGHTA